MDRPMDSRNDSDMNAKLRILAIGGGSIGQRHISNLNALGMDDITLVEPDEARRKALCSSLKLRSDFSTLEQALGAGIYDAALVLTPPALHVPQALLCAQAGMHLFIEKPLSASLDGLAELEEAVRSRGLSSMVGYNQRFNEGILRVRSIISGPCFGRPRIFGAWASQDLPSWRPGTDYTKGYTARRSLGGGIVLEGTHEIDYIIWLAGEQPSKSHIQKLRLGKLDIDVEDTANIILEFPSGASATLHVNMIERGYWRRFKVVSDLGNWAEYDLKAACITTCLDGKEERMALEFRMAETYEREMAYFLRCLETGQRPSPDIAEAMRVLEVLFNANPL